MLGSAACPVWVSLHQERGPAPLFRRVLCAAGLSDSSGATVDWALRLSRAFHASCDLIHVADNSDGREQRQIMPGWLTGTERARLDGLKTKRDGHGELILAAGDLAEAIAAASTDRKSDLLVVGHGRRGNEIGRVLSLPFTLVHRASCPVVAI